MAVAAFAVLVWAAAGLAQGPRDRPGRTWRWGDVARRGADDAEMVFIPAGTFVMGDVDGTGYDNERPAHAVSVAAFWLDRSEVTNAQFARFVAATDYRPQGEWPRETAGKDRHPAVHVTWRDAVAYCTWAGKRLPTEAEWEYAASGPDDWAYPWGDTWDDSLAHFAGNRGNETTAPVGSYPKGASPFGVLDLAGNVWEWTSSLYQPYPYRATDGREDLTTLGPRVSRGGSWIDPERYLRVASRIWLGPGARNEYQGFRCAESVR
jgi:formylglycine-generating enzyme required for sulfatase activity